MPLTIVLSVGFDLSLLRARGLVLESAGYLVESASTVKGAADRFQSSDFDLVLLCHSVPRKDRDRLTSLIRASGSRTPIVSIAGNLGECDAFANATLAPKVYPPDRHIGIAGRSRYRLPLARNRGSLSPNSVLERFACAFPCLQDPRWPSAPRDAANSPTPVPQARGGVARNRAGWPESLDSAFP